MIDVFVISRYARGGYTPGAPVSGEQAHSIQLNFFSHFLFFLFGFLDKILTPLSVYSSCFIIVKRTFINNFTLYRPYVYLILALYLGLHCLIFPKYLRLGLLTLSPIYIGVSKVSLGVWVDF